MLILVFYFAYVGQAWNLMMGFAGQLSLGHALYVGLGGYVGGAAVAQFRHRALARRVRRDGGRDAAFGAVDRLARLPLRHRGRLFRAAHHRVRRVHPHRASTISTTRAASGGLFLPVERERRQWWNLRGGPLLFYYLGARARGRRASCWPRGSRARGSAISGSRCARIEQAARALGINVFRAKMTAVLISSGMTAVGGVFYAFYYNNLFPEPQVFDIGRSIELILAPIVGGLGTVFGPVVGAFILTPLGEALIALTEQLGIDAPGAKAVFYGLALMVIIVLRPSGVWPWLARVLAA